MRAILEPRRALVIAAAAGALAAFVALGLEVVAYEGTRLRWRAISEHVEGAGYDAAQSDALYAAVRARRADAVRNAWIAAALMIVAASGAGALGRVRATSATDGSGAAGGTPGRAPAGNEHHAPGREEGASGPTRAMSEGAGAGRVLAASAIDVALSAAAIAGALAISASSTSIVAADTLRIVLPALAVAVLVAFVARGRTAGQRVLGLSLDPRPGAARSLLVIALMPLTAAALLVLGVPLAVALLAGRTVRLPLVAPHLALAGVRSVRAL